MLQPCRDLDLPEKALGAEGGGELRVQHLERHLAAVFEVLRQVDCGHSPAANLPLDRVSIGENGFKPVAKLGH